MEDKKRFYLFITLVGLVLFFISLIGTKKLYFDKPSKNADKENLHSPPSKRKSLKLPKLLIYTSKELQPEKSPKVSESKLTDSKQKKHLTKEYVSLVLNRQQKYFQRCYENHLRKNPTSKGSMNVSFFILPHGEIKDVEIKHSSFKDDTFETCIKTVFSRVTLKAFDGPSFEVSYPIEFK